LTGTAVGLGWGQPPFFMNRLSAIMLHLVCIVCKIIKRRPIAFHIEGIMRAIKGN